MIFTLHWKRTLSHFTAPHSFIIMALACASMLIAYARNYSQTLTPGMQICLLPACPCFYMRICLCICLCICLHSLNHMLAFVFTGSLVNLIAHSLVHSLTCHPSSDNSQKQNQNTSVGDPLNYALETVGYQKTSPAGQLDGSSASLKEGFYESMTDQQTDGPTDQRTNTDKPSY